VDRDVDVVVGDDGPVLSTHAPWISRARVLAELEMSPSPIVVVSAAAGSGKSTVARQWVEYTGRPSVTLALAPHLDDPAGLAVALIEAMEQLGPPAPDARAAATSTEPTFSSVLLPAMRRLAAAPTDPYVLVVDDLQLVTRPGCHRLLEALCSGIPEGSQAVLLTRSPTPTWLARSRAEARLAEVGPADLAFDEEEISLVLARRGIRVSEAQRSRILDRTEGWAVGVYLSALAMSEGHVPVQGRLDTIPTGADRFIHDYLASQLLDGLDPEHELFLTRSSVLDELSSALCDAVLERADSARILPALHERIQLVIALDDEGRAFRYHHLLADALRARLARDESELVPDLHRRAARWYAVHGDIDAAIRHARWSGDMAMTGALVFDGLAECIGTGHPDLLGRRLAGLSAPQVASDPLLALSAAWLAVMTADMDGWARWLALAEGHAGPEWRARASTDPFAAALAMMHALVAPSDLRDMVTLAGDALAGLPPDSPFRAPTAFLLGVGLTLLRDTTAGKAALLDAVELARALAVPTSEADALSWLGVIAALEGDREEATRCIERASALIRIHHLDRLGTAGHALTAESLLLAMRHDHERAATALAIARRRSAEIRAIAPWFAVCGPLVQARAAVLLGDGATARLLITEARQHMTPDLAASVAQDFLEATEELLRTLAVDGVSAAALTTAELRVLQFLPSHLTLRQIGEQLFLSHNTVKTHALSIYRKLGVTSRAQSVAVARTLGLLDAD
jgi:LuxR family transcriptional regulator, maltose regulon positive regulatory protein